jgi:hypothetical protein
MPRTQHHGRLLIWIVAFAIHGAPLTTLAQETDLDWSWSDRENDIRWYINKYEGSCQIRTCVPPLKDARGNLTGWSTKFTIYFMKDGKALLSWKGHRGSAFLEVDKDVIVYSQYSPISSGCDLVAFDLAASKEIWRTRLKGVGLVSHSIYSNRIILRHGHAGHVLVLGLESAGRYVERIETRSGKTTKHNRLPGIERHLSPTFRRRPVVAGGY